MTGVLLAFAALSMGCLKEDTGKCCETLSAMDESKIPKAEAAMGDEQNAIRQDPAFDCDGLTCVDHSQTADAPAYCTIPCRDVKDCPEGFGCERVLQSDPGPGASIRPEDTFCVKLNHDCKASR